jgi:plastocyanin
VRVAVLGLALAAALVAAGIASGEGPVWSASVGPGFNISLRDAAGNPVSTAPTGPVEINVDDKSEEHNFHLFGPGVDVGTSVDAIESKSFQVTLADGIYRFICDAHPTRMVGQLTAGAGDPGGGTGGGGTGGGGTGGGGTGGGGTVTPKPSAPVGSTLALTSGPSRVISLKTLAGKRVTRLKPGRYTVRARDRSTMHNAHLLGAGVNRKTSVARVETKTWTVVLRKGTLTFICDPHKAFMRGTVKVAA